MEEFDKQHQGLITILNVLSETEMAASFKSARLFVAIMQLKEYAYQHFTSEEKRLLQFDYLECIKHKAEH